MVFVKYLFLEENLNLEKKVLARLKTNKKGGSKGTAFIILKVREAAAAGK